VQLFFHLKFQICTEMPRRDLTLADTHAVLEQIKNQPPNTSHHQLVDIMPWAAGSFLEMEA
jgi:hypothetical protein